MRFFTKKEDTFLRENYLSVPAKRMANILGRSECTARQRMKLLGIVVPPEVVAKFKADSRYKKGSVPFNKGKQMSKSTYRSCAPTMFKKGQVPKNHKPLGSLRVTKDGYFEIKVTEPNKWQAYHRLMWEETFGPIPKGGVVRFVTNNKMNVHPFNLELIDRRKNMKQNSVHNLPKPIALAVQLRGVLNRQINKRIKQINEK